MRLFQNSSLYPSYRSRLRCLSRHCRSYAQHVDAFLADRYGAMHLLEPVLQRHPDAFLANGDHTDVQRVWAREQGMPSSASREDILLGQIEHHRTEVFYNMDPMTFPGAFAKRLPGSVRLKIAWRAAPSGNADFSGYDLMVCNFPGILDNHRRSGLRAQYFSPAYDPEMSSYAANRARPVDIVFVGGFSRHHSRRTEILASIAALADRRHVVIHLENSRLTNLAESSLGRWFTPARYRRPASVQRVARPPVFGRDLYDVLSRAKIVINAAIDMSGQDRGNIRCFEAMGTSALLLSDSGSYPSGMEDGVTMCAYSSMGDLLDKVERLLAADEERQDLATRGHELVRRDYSKSAQWQAFQSLLDQ